MSSTAAAPAPRRRILLVVAVALVLVVAAGWWLLAGPDDGRGGNDPASGGQPTACGPELREPTGGAGRHVDDATYDTAPPSYGDHNQRWEVRAASFYDVEDRPDVDVLVHNLEHGYNILWYDQTVIDDAEALSRVQEIADTYASLDPRPDPAKAFIAAPWTDADGGEFPEGMHYALTHWYADPDSIGSRDEEEGITMYCPEISAEVVDAWMTEHPLRESPEGFPELM